MHPGAWREQKDRPWHLLKTQDGLEKEDNGLADPRQYYMDDDHLKFIALIIAVADRRKHNITSTPALSNESFRNSFSAGGGAMLALTNNADLVSAAEITRV